MSSTSPSYRYFIFDSTWAISTIRHSRSERIQHTMYFIWTMNGWLSSLFLLIDGIWDSRIEFYKIEAKTNIIFSSTIHFWYNWLMCCDGFFGYSIVIFHLSFNIISFLHLLFFSRPLNSVVFVIRISVRLWISTRDRFMCNVDFVFSFHFGWSLELYCLRLKYYGSMEDISMFLLHIPYKNLTREVKKQKIVKNLNPLFRWKQIKE